METFFKTTADLSPSVDHLCILTFEMSPKFDRCRRRQYQSNSLFQVFEIWISKLSREISIQFWDFLKFQQLNSGLMQNVKKIVSFNYECGAPPYYRLNEIFEKIESDIIYSLFIKPVQQVNRLIILFTRLLAKGEIYNQLSPCTQTNSNPLIRICRHSLLFIVFFRLSIHTHRHTRTHTHGMV
jgi:hypothetical protein